jgi:CheY-like chemotaxis protein
MASLTALVVDDASFVRDLVKRTIRQHFPVIETTEAQNGRRAQSLMSRQVFDLILCDWEMPEMSGLELLQWMRQQPEYAKVPFIMITSRGDKDHVVEAIKEGVSEYLGKPFSAEGLSSKVSKVMGNTLKQAMGSSGRSAEPGKSDPFMESASLLTGKSSKPAPASPKAPPTSGKAGVTPSKTAAMLRFGESKMNTRVRDITLTEARLLARSDQAFPPVMAPVVVDIETGEGKMARLNGYVHQLQAVDKRPDSEFVSVTVRFVDDDAAKLEDLSRFIARFRTGQ